MICCHSASHAGLDWAACAVEVHAQKNIAKIKAAAVAIVILSLDGLLTRKGSDDSKRIERLAFDKLRP
jgi:hypothetical protein